MRHSTFVPRWIDSLAYRHPDLLRLPHCVAPSHQPRFPMMREALIFELVTRLRASPLPRSSFGGGAWGGFRCPASFLAQAAGPFFPGPDDRMRCPSLRLGPVVLLAVVFLPAVEGLCAAGQFGSGGCQDCPASELPEGATWKAHTAEDNGECVWECSSEYFRSGSMCTPAASCGTTCPDGQYRGWFLLFPQSKDALVCT